MLVLLLFQITWPENWLPENANNQHVPKFLLTVDGVHCRIDEPTDPNVGKNPEFYSHKFKQAALNYELGISVYDNKLVWMNGPFPASKHDITIFRAGGLKEKIPDGKLVIGDNGYRGEPYIISTPNSHDREDVRRLKKRARARHETFNGKIKNFRCLDARFRHRGDLQKHKTVFEAVCVICQYQLELSSPLLAV